MTIKCEARQWLRGPIGALDCHREAGHDGIHRDNGENLWWSPGAPPLERAPWTDATPSEVRAAVARHQPTDPGSEHPGTWIEEHDHASCVECTEPTEPEPS